MSGTAPLLEVRNLTVAYRQGSGWLRAVDDVSFSLRPGEVFGLVGESGCGKSTVSLQLLGYRHVSMHVEHGMVLFKGEDLTRMAREQLDRLRGDRIAFVPQNPTTALNPGIRVGRQLAETMLAHGRAQSVESAATTMADILGLVGLPADATFQRRYPHQLSGGQQQRVCIAMALACDPDLLVLDEPTTGLDVTTQEQMISLLSALRGRIGVAMLYVTHDLALLSQIADRIGVMYAGRMVEIAPTEEIFRRPHHPYTQGLIASIPTIEWQPSGRTRSLRGLLRRRELPPGCPFAPRCDHATERCAAERQELQAIDGDRAVACWRWREIAPVPAEPAAATAAMGATRAPVLSVDHVSVVYSSTARGFRAVNDVSFEIKEGEVFALVGESGSGKSTLARVISGLNTPETGTVKLRSETLAGAVRDRSDQQRRLIQYIFQNPDASLNPRARIGETIARPLMHFFRMEGGKARATVADALADVRLDGSYQERFPDQLSGGERQRVAIARALAAKPALLLCDEILSALDVSVQANILALLQQLKAEHGIAMLFISHDLAVVRLLADHVCVLYGGEVMEIGPRERIFSPPFHPYTHSLLHAVPVPLRRPDAASSPRAGEPRRGGAGCVYAGRCPWQAGAICETERPPWREAPGGVELRCHLTLEQLNARADGPPMNEKRAAL
jgi:peptide/nickel transport system ATP-binding protein